jgi:protein involved in polysaccharide export with SLBB domain
MNCIDLLPRAHVAGRHPLTSLGGAILVVFMALAGNSSGAAGQGAAHDMSRRAIVTRRELDSVAAAARTSAERTDLTTERRAALQRCLEDAQRRLEEGDFQPGDRIILHISGDSAVRDTFTVQPSQTLRLPNLPPIPLRGVLRSELRGYLATQLREFIRDTLLRVSPLVLVGVLGEVAHPGYYRVALETSVADALMVAGGPTHDADLTRVSVRRGNQTLVGTSEARDAMVRRTSLEQLGVDAGDELVVAAPRTRNWSLLMQVAGLATGALVAFFTIRR